MTGMMTIDSDDGGKAMARARRTGLITALLMIALMAGGVAGVLFLRRYDLGWVGALVMSVVLLVATVSLIRAAGRRARTLGCASPAMLRYNRRMILFSMVYMIAFFAATYAYKRLHVTGPGLWIAGLAPSVGVVGMIWAMARLIAEETDEYLRFNLAKQALVATGLVLVISTVWGFLEQFGLLPHVPSWIMLPLFAVMLGVSNLVRWVRS